MRTLHTSSFTECCVVGLVVCMLWALHVCNHRVCVCVHIELHRVLRGGACRMYALGIACL